MRKILTVIAVLLCYQANAQTVRLGIEIAPQFELNPSRLSKPAINVTAQAGTETVLLHVGINNTQLETGVYFGLKDIKFGVFARVDATAEIQITPVMALRYTHYVRNGLLLEIGAKMELAIRRGQETTYTPLYIGVQKNLIEK